MAEPNQFQQIPIFSQFSDLTDDAHYQRLPEDWWVVIADIQGSTQAIEEGRYKDVNTIGAACIVAAQNAMERAEFPYVFGGDGTTLLIPPERMEAVSSALDAVRARARSTFSMRLRVGAMQISALGSEEGYIEVARYAERDALLINEDSLFSERGTAMFRGGGISAAETRIKADPERYEVPENPDTQSDLSGLSCRWKPIPSLYGRIISLLVESRDEAGTSVYSGVLARLDLILDGDIAKANPIHVSTMGYKSILQLLAEERRLHDSWFSSAFWRNAKEIVYAVAIFKYHLPALFFDVSRYAAAIDTHSDFRKFDDLLRMVVDCSPAQSQQIRDYLQGRYEAGDLFYGIHESGEALMTCFVYGMSDGEHIHFVDGGDGGYAMAAREFKAQKNLVAQQKQ
ncbi:MAG: DUF3095 domain-containing protein [Chromatiales bacterium]|nr:DUF3095 domain-containing protein [Chromatiales bacterium]